MTKRAGAKPGTFPVRQTDDGLHLANSILWLDSNDSGDLSFLSSASSLQPSPQPKVPQVIATEETIKILETYRSKPNALVCQYNRPFSIGRLKMELLPSGCVLGGASLYVETDKGRLLYAPQLQTQRIPTVRQMQLKKAQTLIIGANHPDPASAMPNRKREKERLIEAVHAYVKKGLYPAIICDPVATAQELTKMICDEGLPLAVHDTIFKINNVYETYGSKLGEYTRFSKKYTRQKVTLFPLPRQRTQKLRAASLPADAPILLVEATGEPTPGSATFTNATERFYIGSTCDGPEFREIVALVSPKELYIFGPYAKRYVEEFKGLCPVVKPLFVNDQPTLF